MSSPRNITKIHRLEGSSFDLAKRYDSLAKEAAKEQKDLEQRFMKEQNDLIARYKKSFFKVWVQLMEEVGLDSHITWDNPNYGIERTYIDQGFAAVVEMNNDYSPQDVLSDIQKNIKNIKIPKSEIN